MKPILFALAIVWTATAAAAQQSQDRSGARAGGAAPAAAAAAQQQPTFRTGVDVITVDVGAVDSRGQPVTDLHAPEFTVKIDGKPRRVVSADLVK